MTFSSKQRTFSTAILMVAAVVCLPLAAGQPDSAWKLGTPMVAYWAGPRLTDAVAQQLVNGGWNVAWCYNEADLNVAKRHGLRALLQDGLISPKSLDNPAERARLDALVDRVRRHPALYSYFVMDEPCATDFAALGRIVAYLRQRDPEHLAYINLFPTYASNQQLGTKGDAVAAYNEHLRQFIDVVKPSLLSYDHYQFTVTGDNPDYFLNLALMRQAAQQAGLPFLNIVQSCSWDPSMRVPNGDEMRYLVYTTLAYGAQGISYYVYCWPKHVGGIALPDGTPTPIYHALKTVNPEFVAIATELQPLRSLGIYHAGMLPPGAVPLADAAAFRLDPPVSAMPFAPMKPVKGMLLSFFGSAGKANEPAKPTHVLVVNLDYRADVATALVGPGNLEVFDAAARIWSAAGAGRAEVRLPPGGGKLLRIQSQGQSEVKK
jgi:hypothetical protein